MPIIINGETYYRTTEVCVEIGIGKTTLYRWMRKNVINEAEYRDRKGWRLFTGSEIDRLKMEVNRVQKGHIADNRKIAQLKSLGKDNSQKQIYINSKYLTGASVR